MEEFIGPLRFDEHKAFLRVVHSRGGDALHLGPLLPRAIKRYLKHWLPLVASEGDGARLIPPDRIIDTRLIPPTRAEMML